MKIKKRILKAIEKITDAGLAVAEREADFADNCHITILGGVRRVELYTNGTIYANKVNGKFKIVNVKGMDFNQAIDRAIKIAKKGRY